MAITFSQALPDAADRALFQSLMSAHFTAPAGWSGPFNGAWRGIPASSAEEAAHSIVTVNTADELFNALNAVSLTGKTRFQCNWDGVSTTAIRLLPNALKDTQLVANAAVFWGYDRPASSVIIEPAAGRTPEIKATWNSSMSMTGFNIVEIRGVKIRECKLQVDSTPTYPIRTMISLKGTTFLGGATPTLTAFNPRGCEVVDIDGCTFDTFSQAIDGSVFWLRSWNNDFRQIADDDYHSFGADSLHTSKQLKAYISVLGNLAYDHSLYNITSGLHPDFVQVSTPADRSYPGYDVLAAFNLAHINRGGVEAAAGGVISGSQGVFGSDGDLWNGRWGIFQNIFMLSAYWAIDMFDPNDNSEKRASRNICIPSAVPVENTGQTTQAVARVTAHMSVKPGMTLAPVGSGTVNVHDNIAAEFPDMGSSGRVVANNALADPRLAASDPNSVQSRITGNGTWAATPGAGFLTYNSPDAGAASAAAARTALAAFAKPVGGWASIGPDDPAQWPSGDFKAWMDAVGGAPPNFGSTAASGVINVTVA